MNNSEIKIKLSYITGLNSVVLDELNGRLEPYLIDETNDSIYIEFSEKILSEVKHLRSVARAYLISQNEKYNPLYISNHKSILGDLISLVIKDQIKDFSSFKITCAGSDSPEVRSVARFIQDTYHLIEKDEADLKISIIKLERVWELNIQITPRPLSLRDYKVVNMSGAMDPTIAYAVNSFCQLEKAESYLNIFSGSGTLLIEAGQCYPNLKKIIGFDINKKHLSLSIQNIKEAGLIKRVEIKEGDIFDRPDFGTFDAIVSDLPFGMSISKNEDLKSLYQTFIEYCEEKLKPDGRLVVYTSEHELLMSTLDKSHLKVINTLELKFITSVNAYLRPKIVVCELK